MPAFRTLAGAALTGRAPVLPALQTLPAGWLAMLALAAVDAFWAQRAGVAVAGWHRAACTALLLMAAAMACRRSERWSPVGEMADAAGLWIAFTATGCVLTYLCARCAMPLRDDALESLDRAVGFDWAAWSAWVERHHMVHVVLRLAYVSLLPQIVLCCCVLPLTAGRQRLSELFWSALAAILVTAAVSALLPALGAYQHHGLAERADWLPDLLALRRPGPVAFGLGGMNGVVTMPSFHAVLAVLFIRAHRRTGAVGYVAAALNLTMLVSTPSEGGHYLCDVIAGCMVAAASILVVCNGSSARGTLLRQHATQFEAG